MTDLGTLVEPLDYETGQKLTDVKLIDLLRMGVAKYNASQPPFTLSGTTLDRTASPREQRLIVLHAASIYYRGEALLYARTAITHVNVAGRTSLEGIAKNIQAILKGYEDELAAMEMADAQGAVVEEAAVVELGETLPWVRSLPQVYPYHW